MKVTIQSIQEAAREDGREFGTKQAQRILDRHRQLVKEGQALQRQKRKEIEDAWHWFDDDYNADVN